LCPESLGIATTAIANGTVGRSANMATQESMMTQLQALTQRATGYGRTHGLWIRSIWALAIFWMSITATLAEEQDHSAILARVQLLPMKADVPQPTPSSEAERPADKSSLGTEASARNDASAARFSKWVRHEDEFVSLSFPDDPRVRLEIQSPKDPIPVDDVHERNDTSSFLCCYTLTFNGEAYCVLLLDRTQEFDDEVCFCGPVAFDKYIEHHNALYRFSLLDDGKIKRIQILGDGLRLALLESTRLPIHQEVYAAIGLSVRMRKPVPDSHALRARIERIYGKTGFLEKGMDRAAVVALLGTPASEDHGVMRFVTRLSLDEPPGSKIEELVYRIPMKDGVFCGLSTDWRQRRDLPPDRNSVQWILARLGDQRWSGESLEMAVGKELQPLLERVVELLPKVGKKHWPMLCDAAALLAYRKVKDPRVLAVIKTRYLDPQLSAKEASEVLRAYECEGLQELVAKRIRVEMALARTPEALRKQEHMAGGWCSLRDLFDYLQPTFAQRDALILEAMDHPHAVVRMGGFRYWAGLPVAVARARLRKGLGDPASEVRIASAEALVKMSASEAENLGDLALLKAQRAKETNEAVIEALDQAIKQLE
jgi:hypothetical protein